jgi:hypothetical protein
MSVDVLTPSLVKHVKDMSEKHSDKVLCEETGIYLFPVLPTITASSWNDVQKFSVHRLQLAWVEQSAFVRFQPEWKHATDNLCEPEDAEKLSDTDLIKKFRDNGHSVDIACSNLKGIIMQTVNFIKQLERSKVFNTFEKLQEAVNQVQVKHGIFYNDTDNFLEENPGLGQDNALDIMDSHARHVHMSCAMHIQSNVLPVQDHTTERCQMLFRCSVQRLSPQLYLCRFRCTVYALQSLADLVRR